MPSQLLTKSKYISGLQCPKRYARMSAEGKAEIITLVTKSELPCSKALAQLKLPRSTYYRWLERLSAGRLEDFKGGSAIPTAQDQVGGTAPDTG